MSAVQSHIQTGISNTQFPFSDPEQHKQLHPRQPDVQRPMNPPHLGGSISSQGTMLNLYGGAPQQQQQQQQQQFQPQIPPSQQQQSQQPQGAHPGLGIMSGNQGLVANSGGQPAMQQQMQHQSQLQHHQQQRVLMQQRGLPTNSGMMGNPSAQIPQGMFPPGVNQPMRRISAQPPPHPQGGTQVNIGMQAPQQNQPGVSMIPQSIAGQLRQGGPNARMLANHGPPQHHDMAHVMAVNRQQQSQPQPQTMVNGMQPGQLPRSAHNGQLVGGPPHQMPHQQHQQPPQHRAPFQQQGPLPPHQSHAASPTRPSSHHSQSGTSTANPMITGASGQQPTMRTQQHTSPDNMFMNLQQQHSQNMFPVPNTQHPPPQPQRPPGSNPTFPFLPESSAGAQHHPEPTNQHTPGAPNPAAPPPTRQPQQQQPAFHITPAQTLQQLQQGGQEPFAHVMIPHNAIPHNANPHHPHRMPPAQNSTAPLPVPGPSRPEPAPQAGPSRTPRPPSRNPNQPPTRGPPTQGPSHVQPILPAASPHHRRASAGIPTQAAPSAPPVVQHEGAPAPPQMPRQPITYGPNVVGSGQGLLRLLGFSAALANEKCDRLKRDHWSKVVNDYFHPQASWRVVLVQDTERRESMPFEITTKVLATFLLVSCQSGVRSMNFVLDGARERSLGFGTSIIECPDAQWVWRYYDGHTIVIRGAFSCQITAFYNSQAVGDQPPYSLKFESMNFEANSREKMISLDSIQGTRVIENVQKTPSTTTQGSPDNASPPSANTTKDDADRLPEPDPRILIDHALLPLEPIGPFGIPQAAMRCLELAESLGQMTELIQYGWAHNLGPEEALIKLSVILKHQMGPERAPLMFPIESKSVSLFGSSFPFGNHLSFGNNFPPTSNHPPHAQHMPPPPQSIPPPGQGGLPQAVPMRSPHQAQPQPPPTAPKSGPSIGVSAPSGPGSSLKRKQPEGTGAGGQADSQQPPAKRITRRKSKAGGG